ncbi:MAG: ComEC/Rec2 family competence protein [Akkermansia sp.]|nr:ComEC/Rec2 family competence protein [Akkermansia sp.]
MQEDSVSGVVRRLCVASPLFLPLVGVVGCLLGGQWWAISVGAVVAAHLLKLHRILLCVLLCAAIAFLHRDVQQRNAMLLQQQLAAADHVELVGTVERLLGSGCILNTGFNGVRVALRGYTPWTTGDRVKVVAVEKESTDGVLVPGMFDTGEWMRSQGLAANLQLIRGEYLDRPFSGLALLGYAESVRRTFIEHLMPEGTENDPRRQVLCALVLGDKSRSEYSTLNIFKRGGCLHAFAVSGLHVGIIAGFLYALAYYLRLSPRSRTVVVLVATALYVMVTGLAVPALRAYLMMALALLGLELRRKVSLLNIWSLAALIILLISPWQLYNAGFVLSFAVYAAIGLGVKVCMKESPWFAPDEYLPLRFYKRRHDWLRRFDAGLRASVLVSLSAWLISAPVTVAFFHTITPWSVLTNLAISPLLPPVMGCGLLTVFFGRLPWVGDVLTSISLHLSSVLISVVSFFGSLPHAYLPVVERSGETSGMVCHLGFQASFVVLGNPGMVIDCGREATARFRTEPALFFGGYRPAILVVNGRSLDSCGGVDILRESWPDVQVVDAADLQHVQHFQTSAGRFSVYPAPVDIAAQPAENTAPVVVWQSGGRVLLYIGHAASLTLQQVPDELLAMTDVVIVGHNAAHPVELSSLIKKMRGKDCVLLPGVPESVRATLGTEVKTNVLNEEEPLLLIPACQ